MNDEKLGKEVQVIIEKARRSLKEAKVLFENKSYEGASSRAYYSIFHIMQAALLTKGLSFSKHSGVINGFSQHFIKTGIFPTEFARNIKKLRKDREMGDYDYEQSISREKAGEDIKIAQELVKTVEQYLRSVIG